MLITDKRERQLDNLFLYLSIGVFILSIVLLIIYQSIYILNTHTTQPFLEPDNYMYLLFVHQALLNPNKITISNPYLINDQTGFFEHAGLYLLPYIIIKISSISIIWVFRLIQSIIIITIYLFSLLFTKKIIEYIPIKKAYHYIIYTLIIAGFLLMQYNQIIEFRGNEFITAFTLISIYILAYAFTKNKIYIYLFSIFTICFFAIFSFWMWSGYFIFIVMLLFTLIFMLIYKFFLKSHDNLWKYIILILILLTISLFFLYTQFETLIINTLFFIGYSKINCNTNVLQIGEMNCLNIQNGLIIILTYIIFSSFSLMVLLKKSIFSTLKENYEYYLVGSFSGLLISIPLAFIYIRMISLLAPYLMILSVLGIILMLSYFLKTGSSHIIVLFSILLILAGAFFGQYVFFSTTLILYNISNPKNLTYFNSYLIKNSTILTFFSYGDYLETQHMKVYTDTIQGLNPIKIKYINNIFKSSNIIACNLISNYNPKPQYILFGGHTMLYSILFNNISNQSILKNPKSFNNICNYVLIAKKGSFNLFKLTNQ